MHSALKMTAVWILQVLVPRPATMTQKRWANTAAWWIFVTQASAKEGLGQIFVNGAKSIAAANCRESSCSKIAGPCPASPFGGGVGVGAGVGGHFGDRTLQGVGRLLRILGGLSVGAEVGGGG